MLTRGASNLGLVPMSKTRSASCRVVEYAGMCIYTCTVDSVYCGNLGPTPKPPPARIAFSITLDEQSGNETIYCDRRNWLQVSPLWQQPAMCYQCKANCAAACDRADYNCTNENKQAKQLRHMYSCHDTKRFYNCAIGHPIQPIIKRR